MSVQVVLTCDHLGCDNTSGEMQSENALRWYMPLCESWGIYRRNLRLMYLESDEFDPEGGDDIKDLCPKCCAEIFFMWMYVVVYGNDRMGCAFHIRPHGDLEYAAFQYDYNGHNPMHTAGRALSDSNSNHWTADDKGSNILPAFIFPEAVKIEEIEEQIVHPNEVRRRLGFPEIKQTRPGEVAD